MVVVTSEYQFLITTTTPFKNYKLHQDGHSLPPQL